MANGQCRECGVKTPEFGSLRGLSVYLDEQKWKVTRRGMWCSNCARALTEAQPQVEQYSLPGATAK